jgi:hypothetical protein
LFVQSKAGHGGNSPIDVCDDHRLVLRHQSYTCRENNNSPGKHSFYALHSSNQQQLSPAQADAARFKLLTSGVASMMCWGIRAWVGTSTPVGAGGAWGGTAGDSQARITTPSCQR